MEDYLQFYSEFGERVTGAWSDQVIRPIEEELTQGKVTRPTKKKSICEYVFFWGFGGN